MSRVSEQAKPCATSLLTHPLLYWCPARRRPIYHAIGTLVHTVRQVLAELTFSAERDKDLDGLPGAVQSLEYPPLRHLVEHFSTGLYLGTLYWYA